MIELNLRSMQPFFYLLKHKLSHFQGIFSIKVTPPLDEHKLLDTYELVKPGLRYPTLRDFLGSKNFSLSWQTKKMAFLYFPKYFLKNYLVSLVSMLY